MEITLWGVRGSISSPSQDNRFYGNNTSCVELRTPDGTLVIFDAGSGLHALGRTLPDAGECHLFISHGHSDHTQGLGFFAPMYNPNWTTHIYVPGWLSHLPDSFFDGNMFPVPFSQLKGNIVRHVLAPEQTIELGSAENSLKITSIPLNHPGGNFAYRVESHNSIFAYSGDHEIIEDPQVREHTEKLLRGAHLAVVDAAYNKKDYHPGWGHSAWEDWIALARKVGTKKLLLSHHNPDRTDKELDALQQQLSEKETEWCQVYVAREGMHFLLPQFPQFVPARSDWMYQFIESLAQYRDENVLMDCILGKAREISRAEAGTVFLVEKDELIFTYTHNDKLFPVDKAYKQAYSNNHIPISQDSIAGYVAVTGKIINIPDVHNLPPDVPYTFNSSFDTKTGYHTVSMLVVPFFDRKKELLGVMQLINSLDPRTRAPEPFSVGIEQDVRLLCREASGVLELSRLMRKNIYRLVKMATVHDPSETGPHAERVGAIAAELYHSWAEKRGLEPEAIRFTKSQIRIAAMLHDVGKVAISDLILKKNGKLTTEEFTTMQAHTRIGSALLSSDYKDITDMASDIARHHHQKWDGTGYSGGTGGKLAGEAIPVTARIVALADVFDALVSLRCYKQPMPFDEAFQFIQKESGKHFDPMLVGCFQDIYGTILQVYQRYPQEPTNTALTEAE